MIAIRTSEEIECLRQSNLLVSKTLAEVGRHIKPGTTTIELDHKAYEFIRDHQAVPAFLGYKGYPKTLCTSVNHQVVHGIPSDYVLKEGDIISVDCGVLMNGYFGDSAYTFAIGPVTEKIGQLLKATYKSLYLGIEAAIEGNRVGDIGYAIQNYCEKEGFSVVREMVGHGLGKALHEPPEVPNYGKSGKGPKLKRGMVMCIEPMINMGRKEIVQDKDGWTIRTSDHLPSAHFEHAIAVNKDKAEVLSTFQYIEEIYKLDDCIN
ncbi:MAG: type I methionyl aminopeptidase [Bacteroidales bacterium]|nr:type I methionyl aminopeptidase [Bacteroidales bacterium]MBN2763141.1 type I methionyl aminopeptidase [Bacteroidales bacterium]